MLFRVLWVISAATLMPSAAPVAADSIEDFCKAMQDQFVACQKKAAANGSCYDAVVSVFDASEEASKAANPAQKTEINEAMNLWADMINTVNPQGDEAPKKKAIAQLCERIRQAK